MISKTYIVAPLISIALLLVVSPSGTDEPAREKEVLWEVDDPTCFPRDAAVNTKLDAVDRFVVGGVINEPRKISGRPMTREEAAKAIEARARPVVELVIGDDGRVQLIVPARPEATVADRALAVAASEWVFEPASIDETPVCIRYILTSTVHPW